MKDKDSKKTMKENYNEVHNLIAQYECLNRLRGIFSESQEAEKIIDSLDKDIAHRNEVIKHLEFSKEKLKGEIGAAYQKFKLKEKSGYDAVDRAWEEHNARVAKDKEEKLGVLEIEVKNIVSESGIVQNKLELGKIHLKKLEDRIQVREAQLKSIDDQINKLKEAIA